MISGFKAAIFDMDGTLLDSMKCWRLIALEHLVRHNIDVPDDALVRVFRQSAKLTIEQAYAAAGLEPDYPAISAENLVRMGRHYREDVGLKPGVRPLLDKLHADGVRLCIATATPREYAVEALQKHDLEDYFEFVFDTNDAGCNKAHVEYFEKVAERLGLPLSECVMFEDACYSIRTARKAGLRIVAIEDYSAIDDRDEIKSLANVYVKDFTELI